MSDRHRFQLGLYRRLVRCTPAEHQARHGDSQVQLFGDLLDTGRQWWRLWPNALVDTATVITTTSTRRTLMTLTARLSLTPLSVLNVLAGAALVVFALVSGDVPAWVALPALAVLVQGAYTLAWIGRSLPFGQTTANGLFVVGQTAAFLIGSVGLVAAVVSQSGSSDPEFGPLTIMTIVTVHAIVGLLAAFTQSNDHGIVST